MLCPNDDQLLRLIAHASELCDRAAGGVFTHTAFLTPREAKYLRQSLVQRGEGHRARFWGGYEAAERTCLLLFPDYVCDMIEPGAWETAPVCDLLTLAGEEDPVVALSILGSGYRTLTHRDYLGSLLSLGIEREVLGDIALQQNDAIVFATRRMQSFLLSDIERIAGDAVRVSPALVPPDFDGGRRYLALRETIAQPRLDCIVAALCNLSREAAQQAVRSGLVELDYDTEQRPDHIVPIPAILSVRGVGKFALRSLGTPNKKGRIPLYADQYQ